MQVNWRPKLKHRGKESFGCIGQPFRSRREGGRGTTLMLPTCLLLDTDIKHLDSKCEHSLYGPRSAPRNRLSTII